MSSRPFLKPFQVITNGNMSATITSVATIVQTISKPNYQVSWAGTSPVGTLSAQGSNDYTEDPGGNPLNAGTWTDVPDLSVAISGNSGSGMLDVASIGCFAIRLKYTFTSGTGTMQATIAGKVA